VFPTIFEVDQEASVTQEEILGPVLCVMQARDFEDALCASPTTTPTDSTVASTARTATTSSGRHEFNADTFYFNRKITGTLVGMQPLAAST
jgi:1-pyrroline-5-carboxylate dehydrogenase